MEMRGINTDFSSTESADLGTLLPSQRFGDCYIPSDETATFIAMMEEKLGIDTETWSLQEGREFMERLERHEDDW